MKRSDFERASEYWTEMEDPEKRMPKEENLKLFEDFVKSMKFCAMATGYDDFVRCTPLEYKFVNGCFYIVTEGGFKFRGLSENRRVSLAIFDQDSDMQHLRSVQVYGHADVYKTGDPEFKEGVELSGYSYEIFENMDMPMYLIKVRPIDGDLLFTSVKERGYASRQRFSF